MQSSKQAGVRWIIALAWMRIAISALMLCLAIVFASPWPARSAWLGDFRGFMERGGYAAGDFGPYQIGQMLAHAMLAAVPALLMLLFVARRNLTGLRVVAGVWVLPTLSNPLAWPLSITAFVLTLQPSTKSYCQTTPATAPPAV